MKQNILITGASRGIGRAIAVQLASSETALYLHGRDRVALADTSELCLAKGGTTRELVCDLADPTQIETMIATVGETPLRAIIHNAGVAVIKPFHELSLDEWNRVLAVNVTAPFLLNKGLLGNLGEGSSIVSILSVAAKTGFPGWSSYSMSKFALDGFAQALREELRSRGIRVINLFPAATDTGLWDSVPGSWDRQKMLSAEEVAEAVAFALSRRDGTLVEEVRFGGIAGNL